MHKNIVILFKFFVKDENWIINLEYLDGVTLLTFPAPGLVKRQKHCIQESIVEALKSAVEYLHNRNIVHVDIHYADATVNCNSNVKLIDFGYAESDALDKSFDIEIFERHVQRYTSHLQIQRVMERTQLRN